MDFKAQFRNCTTLSQAKRLYWTLAKQHHPDRGGSTEAMKALNNAFNEFIPKQDDFGNAKQGATSFYNFEGSQEFIEIISRLLSIAEDCFIEVVGDWVWITGDTYSHKETIKQAVEGLSYKARFSKNKRAWYINPEGYKKQSKKQYDLDEIRGMFGSEQVTGSGKRLNGGS